MSDSQWERTEEPSRVVQTSLWVPPWPGAGAVMKATGSGHPPSASLPVTHLAFAVMTASAGGRLTTLVLQTRERGHREVKQLACCHQLVSGDVVLEAERTGCREQGSAEHLLAVGLGGRGAVCRQFLPL